MAVPVLNPTNASGQWCYDYAECVFRYAPCQSSELHYDLRYSDASAAWVLIVSIIVFFMKAGFMLVEMSFSRDVDEKRNVIVTKLQDAFASAFGFFLIGFDIISKYNAPQHVHTRFFSVTNPVHWFFKFTFASNAATIVGGCLVTNKYKLRLPAAFISAFVISGIIHPIVARLIWTDDCHSFSPYRFCELTDAESSSCPGYNCSRHMSFRERLYVLDFAGGGAVHLLGGVAGLVLCLFAKFQEWRDKPRTEPIEHSERSDSTLGEEQHVVHRSEGFWEWMYPATGGEETVSEAALGIIILWFCWFAFNCGSTESVETSSQIHLLKPNDVYPFYGIPSVIAVNMIMSVASGGTIAVLIASWAQAHHRPSPISVNGIANGILSALVAITAGCPFMDYWGACLTGAIAVILYHIGCYLEYKLGIKDTARVVPVHGVCGLWSLVAVALFQIPGTVAECNLHAAFEGLCYCQLRLPALNYGERLLAQIMGAAVMVGISVLGSFLMYFLLHIIPICPLVWVFERIFFLRPRGTQHSLYDTYHGGCLLSSRDEDDDNGQQHRVPTRSHRIRQVTTYEDTQESYEPNLLFSQKLHKGALAGSRHENKSTVTESPPQSKPTSSISGSEYETASDYKSLDWKIRYQPQAAPLLEHMESSSDEIT